MKQVYKCDFCDATFDCEEEALRHEKICSCNPENEITDKTANRLAMVLYELSSIVATALTRLCEEKIPFLKQEFERADQNNCSFIVYQTQRRILPILTEAEGIKRKRDGLRTTDYEDILNRYPEIVGAIEQTLNRRAWNELK